MLGTRAGVTFVKTGLRVHDRPEDRTGVEIGMRLSDGSEIFEGFGSAGVDLTPASAAGFGHARLDYGEPIEAFQAYWMRPEWLPGLAEKTSAWRPKLTPDDRFHLGDSYRLRWERTAHALWKNPRREIREYDAV